MPKRFNIDADIARAKTTYGDFIAFMYGWSASLVINTAALASISFVCARYLGYFIPIPRFDLTVGNSIKLHLPFIADIYPLQDFGVKCVTAAIMVFLTLLNSCWVCRPQGLFRH